MSKGRNTTVVGIRLPDETVNRLKALARKNKLTMTELLKPVIEDYAMSGRGGNNVKKGQSIRNPSEGIPPVEEPSAIPWDETEEFPGLRKSQDYRKSPEQKREVKYPGTPRNALCPCGSGKKYKKCCGW